MNLRKHLRGLATAWLAFQLVSLSAFVPRDCCAAHQAHKPPPAAAADPSCAMQHGDHHAAQPAPPVRSECSLRGNCDGPMAALLSVLSTHGVLTDSPAVSPALDRGSLAMLPRESLIGRLVPPDSPPPRS